MPLCKLNNRSCSLMATSIVLLFLLANVVAKVHALEVHFYRNSCPQAELIVKSVVKRHFLQDPSIPAGLLRLHFHDCFIRGCDASVLLDSNDFNIAEKEAPPNLSLRGFEVIDDAKAALEKACPGTVSCADTLALATRDGVALSGGASYALPTGRRDGLVSTMGDVHLPSPSFSIPTVLASFQRMNMDLVDLTTLLGAHRVGFCHCGFFIDRLYNFRSTGRPDPDMDPNLLLTLRQKCPPEVAQITNISEDPTVFMNQGATNTPFTLDNTFYRDVLNSQATLQLDQGLAFTDITNKLAVQYLKNPKAFKKQFSKSMIKLGNVGVLMGTEGEIRVDCRRLNNDTSESFRQRP